MAKVRNHAGLHVVPFLGEYRIEGRGGAILGSNADDNAHFRNAERAVVEFVRPFNDSLGFVWTTREAAESALATIARKNLQ